MTGERPFTEGGFVTGRTPGEHPVERAAEAADAALALVRQAAIYVRIFTRDLDARLYSNEPFRDAVSRFARARPATFVRILVQDPTPAVRGDHRLNDVIQTLSSHVGIRRVAREWQDDVFAFLVTDDRGLLWRPYGDRFEGTVDFAAGDRAIGLRRWFDDVWEHSTPDPEFRRLGI